MAIRAGSIVRATLETKDSGSRLFRLEGVTLTMYLPKDPGRAVQVPTNDGFPVIDETYLAGVIGEQVHRADVKAGVFYFKVDRAGVPHLLDKDGKVVAPDFGE